MLGREVAPAAGFRHPQLDAVVLEQRRHGCVLAAVERPLVLPRPRSRPSPGTGPLVARPARRPAGGGPTPPTGSPPHRRTPPRPARARGPAPPPAPAAAPAPSPGPASPQSTPARRTRTASRRARARWPADGPMPPPRLPALHPRSSLSAPPQPSARPDPSITTISRLVSRIRRLTHISRANV